MRYDVWSEAVSNILALIAPIYGDEDAIHTALLIGAYEGLFNEVLSTVLMFCYDVWGCIVVCVAVV